MQLNLFGRNPTQFTSLVQLSLAAPFVILRLYQHYLGLYPQVMDAMTGMVLYLLGKVTSDAFNHRPWAKKRIYARWATMGLLDGYMTHAWYWFIEAAAPAHLPLLKVTGMILTSSLVYTPLYCLGFLLVMGILEGKSLQSIQEKVQKNLLQLTTVTVKTWAPLNVILFGLIPLQSRVCFSMICHYVYLIGLAMWESGILTAFILRMKNSLSHFRKASQPLPASSMAGSSLMPATAMSPVDDSLDLSSHGLASAPRPEDLSHSNTPHA